MPCPACPKPPPRAVKAVGGGRSGSSSVMGGVDSHGVGAGGRSWRIGRVFTVKPHLIHITNPTLWRLCSCPSGQLKAANSRQPVRDS